MLRLQALEKQALEKPLPPVPSANAGTNHFGVPAGTLLNDFSLPKLGGGSMTLSQWSDRMVALIFFDPNCPHCRIMLPDLGAALTDLAPDCPQPVIVTMGSEEANRKLFEEYPVPCPVVLQNNSEVARQASVGATPLALLVDKDRKTAGNALIGSDQILALFQAASKKECRPTDAADRLAKSRLERNGLKSGTVAPEFRLPKLDGGEISLGDYRGQQVLLVFSDPECSPCNLLSPKLERLLRDSPERQIVMISRGDPEANRAKVRQFGLTYPVVLQKQWEVSRDYGMFATPIGYLVNENGVLAADVAVGAEKILELAAAQRVGISARASR